MDATRSKVFPQRVTGTVSAWKGKFGFIEPTSPINHPGAKGKQLYLAAEDVEQELSGVGGIVSFFVYAGAKGLGAMNVRPSAVATTTAGKGSGKATAPAGKASGKAAGKTASKAPAASSAAPGEREKVVKKRLTGTVQAWKGKFGFIEPSAPIDHPMFKGKLYFGAEDVEAELEGVGGAVSFFVYSDAKGIGAMNVKPATAGKGAPVQAAKGNGKVAGKGAGKTEGKKTRKGEEPGSAARPKKQKTDGPTGPNLDREQVGEDRFSGEVVSWKGKWGFVKPAEPIDHPDFKEIIWFAKEDVTDNSFVKRGQTIEFDLYKDTTEKLGAQNITVLAQPETEDVEVAQGACRMFAKKGECKFAEACKFTH